MVKLKYDIVSLADDNKKILQLEIYSYTIYSFNHFPVLTGKIMYIRVLIMKIFSKENQKKFQIKAISTKHSVQDPTIN